MTSTSPINDLENAVREAIRVRGVLRARVLFRAEPGATNVCVSAILKAVHAYSGEVVALAADQASQIGRLAVQGDNDVRTITLLRSELAAAQRVEAQLRNEIDALRRHVDDLAAELQARLAAKPAQNRVRKPRQTQTGASTGTGKPQTGTGDPEAAE